MVFTITLHRSKRGGLILPTNKCETERIRTQSIQYSTSAYFENHVIQSIRNRFVYFKHVINRDKYVLPITIGLRQKERVSVEYSFH